MPIRISAGWLAKWDDRILEILRHQGPSTPSAIVGMEIVDISSSYASQRLTTLREHNLVTNLGNGVYQITDDGIGYLDGCYDPRTQ